jgi:cytochrome c553
MSPAMRTLLIAALLAAAPAFAGTPDKVSTCAACHGADGKSTNPAMYPNLAGQYMNYLEHSLKDYRSGVRKNPIMGAQAVALTDVEIHELAEYFSQQQGPLYTPSIPR